MICSRVLPPLVALLALGASFSTAAAQARPFIACVRPDSEDCSLNVGQSFGLDSIILRVVGMNAENKPVTVIFSPEFIGGAHGTLTSTQQTDHGEVKAYWFGELEDGSVVITAKVAVGTDTVRRLVTLLPPKPKPKYAVRRFDTKRWEVKPLGPLEYWYSERQLSHPATVEITTRAGGRVSPDDCRKALVLFRQTSTGAVTPDSVYGRMVWRRNKRDSLCLAPSYWTLGKAVGEHHVRAGVTGDPAGAVEFRARARALPRVMAGLALTSATEFNSTKQTDTTFHVEHVTATGKVAFDSVVQAKTTSHIDAQWNITPVAGIDWPLFMSIPRLRVSAAVSLKDPTKDWFAGFSLLQLPYGLKHEAVGVDVQGIAHFSKRSSTELVGGGLMLTFDTALLSVLTTVFPLK